MKILVLQLARLGDIYQTWPTLNAIKRSMPGVELHFLTRRKFAAAAPADRSGLVDRHWVLDTREILAPLIDEKPAIDDSLTRLQSFAESLRAEKFDHVINLSFSPFSSFLVREITEGMKTQVSGYTRFDDGYLMIPDDGSAYFYAQTGAAGANRLHVTELMAYVAGVQLTEEDWKPITKDVDSEVVRSIGDNAVVIHLGASDLKKTLSPQKWLQVLKALLRQHNGSIVLIGSSEEKVLADQVSAISGEKQVVNLVGKTDLQELFTIVRRAKLLIGGDSAPVQIASLTGTPVFNLSFPMVSFWETGPRSAKSRILPIQTEDEIASDEIAAEALMILGDRPTRMGVVRVLGPTFPYVETRPQPRAFEWELVRAIYMGEAFPPALSETFIVGLQRLEDVNRLAIEQISTLRRVPANKTAAAILDRVDEIMEHIQFMVPELSPLISWFRVERLRIGPMAVSGLVDETQKVHQRLADVLALYVNSESGVSADEGGGNDDAVLG